MREGAPRSSWITRPAIASCLVLLSILVTSLVSAATQLSGLPAPDFVLKSLSGENLRLSEYRGQVVIVTFWATWCGDCRAQLSEFNALHDSYQDDDFELLAVSLDQDWSELKKTATELDLSYPTLHDADLVVSKLYDVNSMPVSVLIDRDGFVREVVENHRRAREQSMADRVGELLGDW